MRGFLIHSPKYGTHTVLVDNEDYDEVMKYKWCVDCRSANLIYARRTVYNENGKRTVQRIHQLILNVPKGMEVDHIDGNGLNNAKRNLRICSHNQNGKNTTKYKNNISGFKGVSWQKGSNKYSAQIRIDKKKIHLGYFVSAEDASKAYNKKAKELFGEFYRKDSR